jgi:hypothetical protein
MGLARRRRSPGTGRKNAGHSIFRPVPGLSFAYRPPSAYALGYILTPSGLPARTPRSRSRCSRAAPPRSRQEHLGLAPIEERRRPLLAAAEYPSTLKYRVTPEKIPPETDRIQLRRYSRSRLRQGLAASFRLQSSAGGDWPVLTIWGGPSAGRHRFSMICG